MNTLVIRVAIADYDVTWVFINLGSFINNLFKDMLDLDNMQVHLTEL